jgi:phage terminase large subunit-like protein
LIWDDLTKGRKEADSLTMRNDTYNAYIDDARTRKKPQAWEVGIGTRWHEDEIMGRILPDGYAGESGFIKCRDGNVWFVVCIPAQAERDDDPLGRKKGEYIWKEWFGEGFWADKKVNPRSWASLYQQRPAPEEGIYFKGEWFRTYTVVPDNVNYYISYDPAVTGAEEENEADDTCIQVWAVDQHGKLYLVDEWVHKATMDIWIDKLMDWVILYKPLELISESGVIRRASEPYLKRAMRDRRAFVVCSWMGRNADKSAMARPLQAMMASEQIYLPQTSVGQDTKDEFLRFPAGKADHRVDASANLCLRLEQIWETAPPDAKDDTSAIIGGEGIKISSLMPERHPKRKSRWSQAKTRRH